MIQGGRGEMHPDIQSAGRNDSSAEAVSVPCTSYNKATDSSSREAENLLGVYVLMKISLTLKMDSSGKING